jgi:transcriptional antiterminator RfaH
MERWYVVHTQARAEQKAAFHLRSQGFESYLPRYAKQRRHARRTDWVPTALFPRYLFVRLDPAQARWRSINSTVGVSYIVSHDNVPTAVPESLIREIRAREDAAGLVRLALTSPVRVGDTVRFIAGPMFDRSGIFMCERDDDRVVILLELLGRPIEVVAHRDAVVASA